MKNFVISFLLLGLLCSSSVFAQWSSVTSGTTQELRDVHFVKDSVGWVVGDNGTIRKTTDIGTSWVSQNSVTSNYINGIHFISENAGWAVGVSGTVRKTVNGGTNWTSQNSGTSNTLRSVFFVDDSWGWAIGASGKIVATSNGGTNWTSQNSITTQWLSGIYFVNASTGWVVGDGGTIRYTSSYGSTWEIQTSGTTNTLHSVYFVNSSIGWTVGDVGTILKTTNSGTNWIAQTSGTTNNLRSVQFINSSIGWAVGEGGVIRRTTDGGATWSTQNSGTTNNLFATNFSSMHSGWAVGGGGIIIKHSPPAISSVTPANNSVDVALNPILSWTSDYSVIFPFYRLQVSLSPTFATTITDLALTVSAFQLSGLANNTIYYWRIRFETANAPWSNTYKFTTLPLDLGHIVSGTVKYANSAQTQLNNCLVIAFDSNNVEAGRTTTDSSGNFSISGLNDGVYSIRTSSSKTSGGVNTIDLFMIRQKIAAITTFTSLQLLAADINGNGTINTLDIFPLRQKIANQSSGNWLVPNFVFYPQSFTISGQDVSLQIQALCGGDVNGSFTPID